jgi:site-specific DNA-adenine methylase
MHRGFDHIRFAENVLVCPHRWTITYNASQEIKDRFSGCHQQEWQLTYTMKASKRSEEDKAKLKVEDGVRQSDKTGKCGKELLIWNWGDGAPPVVTV